jgi:hypothetical protein
VPPDVAGVQARGPLRIPVVPGKRCGVFFSVFPVLGASDEFDPSRGPATALRTSRKLKALGHDARLMPAKYARPSSQCVRGCKDMAPIARGECSSSEHLCQLCALIVGHGCARTRLGIWHLDPFLDTPLSARAIGAEGPCRDARPYARAGPAARNFFVRQDLVRSFIGDAQSTIGSRHNNRPHVQGRWHEPKRERLEDGGELASRDRGPTLESTNSRTYDCLKVRQEQDAQTARHFRTAS